METIYKNKNGKKYFRLSFCAYLDILGFKEKIMSNDMDFFNNYLRVLEKELAYIDDNFDLSGLQKFKAFELKIFTDNFVFGHPWYDQYGEYELGTIFSVLAHIQYTFIQSNIFIRGGISMSKLYMDDNVVLGPAIIESYKLENEKAIFPRIILSGEVKDVVHKHIAYYSDHSESPQAKEYLVDIDGYYVINYLYTLIEEEYSKSKINEELVKHKTIVIKNIELYKNNSKLYEKYAWVGRYHNQFCSLFLKDFSKDEIKALFISDSLINRKITKVV